MKEHGIIHPRLAALLAEMGHGDLLCIADAGLPIPPGVERIDLAFTAGSPAICEVVDAVLTELRVEGYVLADESKTGCPAFIEHLGARLEDVEVEFVSHDELKARTHNARGVVRTGEYTSYANVLLRSGVDFSVVRQGDAAGP